MKIPGFTANKTIEETDFLKRIPYRSIYSLTATRCRDKITPQFQKDPLLIKQTACYWSCVAATGEWMNCGTWCGTA